MGDDDEEKAGMGDFGMPAWEAWVAWVAWVECQAWVKVPLMNLTVMKTVMMETYLSLKERMAMLLMKLRRRNPKVTKQKVIKRKMRIYPNWKQLKNQKKKQNQKKKKNQKKKQNQKKTQNQKKNLKKKSLKKLKLSQLLR